MPIYEYRCRTCDAHFEALVFGNEEMRCPECKGASLERLMSACGFKRSGDGAVSTVSSGASACSGCTGTNCSSCH